MQTSALATVAIFIAADNVAPPDEVPQEKAPLRSFPATCGTIRRRANGGGIGDRQGKKAREE